MSVHEAIKIVCLSTPSIKFLLTNLKKSLFKSNHFSICGHLDFFIKEGQEEWRHDRL